MRFRFVEEQRGAFPIDRLYQVMNVSPRGLRAFRSRPASRRQRTDMVVLLCNFGTRWRAQSRRFEADLLWPKSRRAIWRGGRQAGLAGLHRGVSAHRWILATALRTPRMKSMSCPVSMRYFFRK